MLRPDVIEVEVAQVVEVDTQVMAMVAVVAVLLAHVGRVRQQAPMASLRASL